MVELPDEEFIEVEIMDVAGAQSDPLAPALTPDDSFADSQAAPETGVGNTTRGPVDKPVAPVTQTRQSPVKESTKNSVTKPAANVDNTRREQENAMARQTNAAVSNAFANAANKNNVNNNTADNSPSGRKTGNTDSAASPNSTGRSSGTVGGGWKMPTYSNKIRSNEAGWVKFEVMVNKDGSVGKVTPISVNGLTSATVAACSAEIKSRRFTHGSPETAQPTTATVTFNFVDPK